MRPLEPVLRLGKSEPRVGLERIVRAAAQLQVGGIRGAAIGERDDVMEFEEAVLGAAAVRADERAAAVITRPDHAFHRGGDVAGAGRRSPARAGPDPVARRLTALTHR